VGSWSSIYLSPVPGVVLLVDILVGQHGSRAQDHQLAPASRVLVQRQHRPVLRSSQLLQHRLLHSKKRLAIYHPQPGCH
jgi:hypothetical protein